MRIGIFGGSFDPVHYGHLLLAECCREQTQLDKIWFMPTAVSPFKLQSPPAEGKHRLEMLKLGIAGYAPFEICTLEIDRGGVSYTVETLDYLKQQHPTHEFFLMMGADTLHDFAAWKNPARICELATPLVMQRGGTAPADLSVLRAFVTAKQLMLIEQSIAHMPQVEISSSEIRQRTALGKSLRFRMPRAVEEYVLQHRLYVSG
jgi:nicotinate-nucleotide adenylyltransferase